MQHLLPTHARDETLVDNPAVVKNSSRAVGSATNARRGWVRDEDTLLSDPDAEIDLTEHLFAIADDLHLALDVSKLRDELLGTEHHTYPQPGTDPARNQTPPPDA